MFYDLNVPWSTSNASQVPRTLAFLSELGYNVVALNHQISGKLPPDLTCPIPSTIPDSPPTLHLLRRCTLTLTDSHQNARLAELAKNYDLLALRPIDEKTLSLACTSLDCDLISLDLSQRLPFWFKYKMFAEAVKGGKKLEICYAQGVLGDAAARRNLISNATQLIRASRGGRGVVISSEARSAVGCRGPWDAINLTTVWGLGQERGVEAMGKECGSVVVSAQQKRTSYRGVIDVVYGGEKPAEVDQPKEREIAQAKGKQVNGHKRKADAMESTGGHAAGAERAMSKRQMKKQAKEARRQGLAETAGTDSATQNSASEVPQPANANG